TLNQTIHSDIAVVLAIECFTATQWLRAERDVDAEHEIIDANDVRPRTVAHALRTHRCGEEPHRKRTAHYYGESPPSPDCKACCHSLLLLFVAQVTMKVRDAAPSPYPRHPNFVY